MIRPHEFATLEDIVIITPEGVKREDKCFYHEIISDDNTDDKS
jgi:hypothetical protein